MNSGAQKISAAVTEAQALLTLVAEKLQADALEAHEIFILRATVQVTIERLYVCHDVQFDAVKTAKVKL